MTGVSRQEAKTLYGQANMKMEHYLDPQNAAFAKAMAGLPPPHALGYEKAREQLEILQKHDPSPDIIMETIQAPGEGDSVTDLVIFRSKYIDGPLPTVFYSHGGGWILGRYACILAADGL